MFNKLRFRPLRGLTSPHLQIIISSFASPGYEPPTQFRTVPLHDGDQLSCALSTPPKWQPHHLTVALIHGLGGNHQSAYMIRLARKFFAHGIRVIRINLRGCGSGAGLNQLTYNSGNSGDVIQVLEFFKHETPRSPINLIGFSLGGNISIKLAGELQHRAETLLNRVIAVCPVLDLAQTIKSIGDRSNWVYHQYFLNRIYVQGKKWVKDHKIISIRDFDEKVTAPLWGYASAQDYYEKCSSHQFLSRVALRCDLVFAADDPFIDYKTLRPEMLTATTQAWLSDYGSHMGFIGKTENRKGVYWMDELLLDWNIPDATLHL